MPGPVFLENETVALRTIEEEDIDFMQAQVNDHRIWRPIGRTTPINRPQEEAFFEEVISDDDTIQLMIVHDGEPVGMVGANSIDWEARTAELGYWVAPDAHDQGYGTAATELFVEYAFEQLGLHRLSARVFAFNEASSRLLERVGFQREGVLRETQFIDGERHDTHWYGLLAAEWRAARD